MGVPPEGAMAALRRLATARKSLTEHESKEMLSFFGVPVVEGRLCQGLGEAVEAADEIGYPVVLKVMCCSWPTRPTRER